MRPRRRNKHNNNNKRCCYLATLISCRWILRLALALWMTLLLVGGWFILSYHRHHNLDKGAYKRSGSLIVSGTNIKNTVDKDPSWQVPPKRHFDDSSHNHRHPPPSTPTPGGSVVDNDTDHKNLQNVLDASTKQLRHNNDMQHKQQQQQQQQHAKPRHVRGISPQQLRSKNDINNTNSNNNNIPQQQQQPRQLPSWIHDNRLIQQVVGVHNNNNNNFMLDGDECSDFHHEFLHPTHGCAMNPDTFITSCNFFNGLRIDTRKIIMITSSSSYYHGGGGGGGESLQEDGVMGRPEAMELPSRYEKGAFSTPVKPSIDIPDGHLNELRYVGDVLNSLEVIYPTKNNNDDDNHENVMENWNCAETWAGTTLFITRYEYANLYHTLTDWWNAFFSLPAIATYDDGSHQKAVNVVFLDAHAQGSLDPVWERIFGPYTYVKHLPTAAGQICFERAVLIPVGYRSELFPRGDERLSCPNRTLAKAFANHVLQSYGIGVGVDDEKPIHGSIVIIDRQPYIAHPRSDPNDDGRRILENLGQLQEMLSTNFSSSSSSNSGLVVTSVDLVRLETMSFEEQLRTIRKAHIVIGNHGAGLSMSMFMVPTLSYLIELNPLREFFSYLTEWSGVLYESLVTSSSANSRRLTTEDMEAIKNIVGRILRY